MPVYQGSNEITNIYLGNTEINEVYNGSTLVYSGYKEIDLGLITVYGTGDYANNFYSTAHAIKIRDRGKWYLKITGYWHSKGNDKGMNEQHFPTNINVGAQKTQRNFYIYHWNNRATPGTPGGGYYARFTAYITTSGLLYLMLCHENVYNVFDQYDYAHELITLDPV